jgi:hypothetical protein
MGLSWYPNKGWLLSLKFLEFKYPVADGAVERVSFI